MNWRDSKFTQSFSHFEDEYALNETKDDLVVVGKNNIQESIDSFKDCALDAILDKFLLNVQAGNIPSVQITDAVEDVVDFDLINYCDALETANKLKIKYGLDPNMSITDVYALLNKAKSGYDEYVKGVIDNEKKEIKDVEKQA